ncbi:MAG TPA: hypothetical protein VH765_03830 [Xanthobacteraceae bacterium]|jgi:hypothetical protein
MKKIWIAFVAGSALVAATIAAPQPAKADISGWWLLPTFVVGTWVGAAHGPFPFFGPSCWYEKRKVRGKYRTVRVCY